jgi:hypothetical protein
MGMTDRIKAMLPGGEGNGTAYWVYVQCGRCGEALRVRVDRRWDLMQEFDDRDRVAGYSLHKDIVGSRRCFQVIHVDQDLDASARVKAQRITGGRFLTRQEYESLAAAAAAPTTSAS